MKKTKTYKSAKAIKVGVVGYGGAFNMGRQHLQEMSAAGMTPVAVAEVDPTRLSVAEQDFPGIGLFSSVREMLAGSPVDLVTIITPHNTHAPIAIECLKAGRHVVCEKPLAITTAEVDSMIAAAKKSGVMLSTYHNRHWDGRIRQAVDLIRKKKVIGDVIRIRCYMGGYGQPNNWWRTSRSISGGILYDWGVHLLEYSLQLVDAKLTEVSGFSSTGFWGPLTKWKEDANEDEGFLVARFDSGQWLTLTITQIDSKPADGWVEVTGKKGTLIFGGADTALHLVRGKKQTVERFPNPEDQSIQYYKNVAAHLTGGEELVITPEWSRRPIHILDLAARSAKTGKALAARYS
jgi:scyllo-inositol 2-dehydrogenase (NADP+)